MTTIYDTSSQAMVIDPADPTFVDMGENTSAAVAAKVGAEAAAAAADADRIAAEAARDAALAAADGVVQAPRVLIEGDSIMAQNHNPTYSTNFGVSEWKGELCWARALYPYFEMDQWGDAADTQHYSAGCNVAVGGCTSTDVLARVNTTTNIAPDIICLAIGINDINGGDTASNVMARIEQIVRYYTGLGKQVLLGNLRPVGAAYPHTDWSNGSSRMTQRSTLNASLATFAAAAANVHLVDLAAAYEDPGNANRPRAGDMSDHIHPSASGAFRGGQAWLAALKKLIKPLVPDRPGSANLISNGIFAGTGGSISTGVTGVAAPDWVIARQPGGAGTSTAVASKDGSDRQKIVITPGGGTGFDFFQISRETGGGPMVAGKWYKARLVLTLKASAYWRPPYFICNGAHMAVGGSYDPIQEIIPANTDLTIEAQTPIFNCPADQTGTVVLRLGIDVAAGSAMEAIVHGVYLQEVADPRPLHNL